MIAPPSYGTAISSDLYGVPKAFKSSLASPHHAVPLSLRPPVAYFPAGVPPPILPNRTAIRRHLPPFPRNKTLVHKYKHVQNPCESYFPHRYLPATPKNQIPFRRNLGGPRLPRPPSCIPKYGPSSSASAQTNAEANALFRNQSLDSGFEPSRRQSHQQITRWTPRQLPTRPNKPKYNPEAPWESSVEDDWTTIQNDSLDSCDNNLRNYCSDYENYQRWQSDNEQVLSASRSARKNVGVSLSPNPSTSFRASQNHTTAEDQSRQASFESQSS